MPVAIEQEGKRHADEGEKGGDGAGPVDAETVVHAGGEKGERGAEEGAQDAVGGEDAGGVDGVRVDEVVGDAQEDEDHAEAEGRRRHDAHDPVDARGVGPREPEQAGGQADGAEHAWGEAGLGRGAGCAGGGGGAEVALVVGDGVGDGGEHAGGDAEEGEAADAGAPAAVLLEDDGEGGEHHVEGAVDDGHVDAEEEDDGFAEEENPWAG